LKKGQSEVNTLQDITAGLQGYYYNGTHFDDLVRTRNDHIIDFDWGGDSPIEGVNDDNFSIRWEGLVLIDNDETVTFYTLSDDGNRLWIGDRLVVNAWRGAASEEYSGSISLAPGYHSITLEYFEGGGGANCQLFWSSPSIAKEIVPADHLFNGPSYEPPSVLLVVTFEAITYHGGDDFGHDNYGYDFEADVYDRLGDDDVSSVVVTTPGGSEYALEYRQNENRYYGWVRNLSDPSPLGACLVRVTDTEGNVAVAYDTLTALMDFPRNVSPAYHEVVDVPNPTFRWNAVPGMTHSGTSRYRLHVWEDGGDGNLWGGIDIYGDTSIVFNQDGTAQDLRDGHAYWWDVYAFHEEGSYGYHEAVRFIYSTETESPILSSIDARSGHSGDDDGNHEYSLYFNVNVADPQGPDDISTVEVIGPTGLIYTLNDMDWNGRCNGGISNLSDPPALGAYTFRVTDLSGNRTEAIDSINIFLGYPRNVQPAREVFIPTATPTFSWEAIPGVENYQMWVHEINGRQIWHRQNMTTLSVLFNDDGNAEEDLVEGHSYRWQVRGDDADGNWGAHDEVTFTYSTETRSPVLSDARACSRHAGDDRGNHDYALDFEVNVADPQGMDDVVLVQVTGPTGNVYTLHDNDNDRVYDAWIDNLPGPPDLGAYTFRATDLSGNWTEALDSLTRVLDYPKNVQPARNAVISTPTPTFSWDAVPHVDTYHVRVERMDGHEIWHSDDTQSSSLVFNDNGNADGELTEGQSYQWMVRGDDDDNNWGEHYWLTFTYSTETQSPILSNTRARSAHYGDDRGNYQYVLEFGVTVADPQGLDDVQSVEVAGPIGEIYTLFDNNQDGSYNAWIDNLPGPPNLGAYTFRATDLSGNWTETVDSVNATMDYPRNVQPARNAVVSTSTPTFSWDAVPNVDSYHMWVNRMDGHGIWRSDDIQSLSVVYNDNGNAGEDLTDGQSYKWGIRGDDVDGNWGEHDEVTFTYSTETQSPILSNTGARSAHYGDDRGNHKYVLEFDVTVADPQGQDDVGSVRVTGPGGDIYLLYDNNQDGSYDAWVDNLPDPPEVGAYTFRASDLSGNRTEAVDSVTGVLDYPKNVQPAQNAVIATPTPTFSWDAVPNADTYHMWVNRTDGHRIWHSDNMTTLSVVYNDNGSAEEDLAEGQTYGWGIRGDDVDGNWGEHYGVTFAYSTNTDAPILNSPESQSGHYGNDRGDYHYFSLGFNISVSDPQGIQDISRVEVIGPVGSEYVLEDNNQDGWFNAWYDNLDQPPPTGAYTFVVTDKSNNQVQLIDTIFAVLDLPANVRPAHNEVITTSTPVFQWDAVPGAIGYRVRVEKTDGNRVWWKHNLTSTSVMYNYNGSATEDLTDGNTYRWTVTAYDAHGNFGEQYDVSFIYSLNSSGPVISSPSVGSRHWCDRGISESWGLQIRTYVSDPSGLSQIDSVWVESPNGIQFQLYDDGNHDDDYAEDGRFGTWIDGLEASPLTGAYTFHVMNRAGQTVSKVDTLTAVLDYPANLVPGHNDIVTDSHFLISWDEVEHATWYEVQVLSADWTHQYWNMSRSIHVPSITYNADGGGESLKEGSAYYLMVRAGDEKNSADVYGIKFAYRADNRRVVYVDSTNTSNSESGTQDHPFNTLIEGVNASVKGDTVWVAPGTYDGMIDNVGSIALIGADPMSTIVKGYLELRSPDVMIEGFTITESDRSGIQVYDDVNPIIRNNIIVHNADNGITLRWGKSSFIINNTIASNGSYGIDISYSDSLVVIQNNIIYYNSSGGVVRQHIGTPVQNTYNCYYGSSRLSNLQEGVGDIVANPQFIDESINDYRLNYNSPCIDAGDSLHPPDPDGSRADIGALYFNKRTYEPPAPQNIAASVWDRSVTLTWDPGYEEIISYTKIYRSLSQGFMPTPADSVGYADSPDSTFTDTGLSNDIPYYYRLLWVTIYGTEGATSDEISGVAGLPPTIIHTSITSANLTESVTITTNAEDPSGIQAVTLYYRQGGKPLYTAQAMASSGGSVYTGTIPETQVRERGIEYYIHATDSYDNTSTDPQGMPGNTPHQILTIVPNLTAPEVTVPVAYRMVSIPLELYNKSAGDIFLDDLGSYDIKQWRLYRYQNGNYVEYSEGGIENAEPGRSYWLITREREYWDTGSGLSVSTDVPVSITLQPGWNMIGCPYSFRVSWSDVDKGDANIGSPVGYSGHENELEGYDYNRTVLQPWKGYLVRNLESTSATIEIPPRDAYTSAGKGSVVEQESASGAWEIEIIEAGGKYQDRGNRIGVQEDSKETWDPHDYMEVPAFGDYVRMVFPHEDWEVYPGEYSGDYRSTEAENHEWLSIIHTRGIAGEVRVEFRDVACFPKTSEIRFIDEHLRRVVDPREEQVYRYSIVGSETKRSIRILVGEQSVVDERVHEIVQLPERLILFQNYPNPFNMSTILRFSLPESGPAQLTVYDVMGRVVRILMGGSTREAGIYEVMWDGTDNRGYPVGSGIYIVLLKTDSGSKHRKIVLVE